MIVTTIDIWPYGLERAKRRLGNIIITNDGTGDRTTGSYDVIAEEFRREGDLNRVYQCRVEDFTRANGIFSLLSLALARFSSPSPWLPITLAPVRQKLLVLNRQSNTVYIASREWIEGREEWVSDSPAVGKHRFRPTHFAYLPSPPELCHAEHT
jgi:hypothetical protein